MSEHNILGAILAGGKSKRMGKDKLFLEINNKKLIEHSIDKVKKYLKQVIIITNQNNEFFLKNNLKDCSWIATFPCDTPFFPEKIIQEFIEKSKKKDSILFCASSHGRKHNIFGLWSLELYDKLMDDLINNKIRKVEDWTEKHKITNVEFKFKEYDPFFNINTSKDLEIAKKIMKNEKQ